MPTHVGIHFSLDNGAQSRYVWGCGCSGTHPARERGSPILMPEDDFGGARSIPAASQRGLRSRARGPAMLGAELRRRVLRAVRADPDVMLYAARVSVWARWLGWLVGVFQLAYRPGLWFATDKEYLFLSVPLLAFNGFVHYRLRRDRAVTWRWLLFLSGMDIVLITAAVIIGGDFHLFSYVTYYPALALFAIVFASLWLSLAWATMAAAIYAVVSLTVGPGLDFDAGQEKALLFRVVAMYAVVASVSLIARFERDRRQESAERERELLRERIELSQAIHDTAAQTAYMIGLGDTQGHEAGRGLERGADRHAGRDRIAVEGGHLGAAASHRRGASLRGEGAGPGALVAHRRHLRGSHRSPPRCSQSGTEPPLDVGDPSPPLLHCPQRAHQRIPARRGRQGRGPAGLRDRLYPAVRLGRRDWPARGLRRARKGIQGHEGGRRAAWAAGSWWRRAELNGGTTVTCETPYR